MASRWDSTQDPTLQGRTWANNFRYATFFWGLLVIGLLIAVSSAVQGRPLGIVGGACVVAAAFVVRQAGRVRRDEIDVKYTRAYGAEALWFVVGLALFIGGAYLFHLSG